MKIIPTLLFTFLCFSFYSQNNCFQFYSFDDGNYDMITIDSISNLNNVWQIGKPNKQNFNQSFTPEFVIITDTINNYPINSSSYFTITTISCGGFEQGTQGGTGTAEIIGYYNSITDTLNDFGKIEISFDNGAGWINLLEDSLRNTFVDCIPNDLSFTGNSNGWQYFQISFSKLGQIFESEFGDTILYRFSFISDSNSDSLPGLMFDELYFQDQISGINRNNLDNPSIKIFPNPAHSFLNVYTEVPLEGKINIYNNQGKIVRHEEFKSLSNQVMSIDDLYSGSYIIEITTDEGNNTISQTLLIKH